jgi:formylglycine-generating enzyme required for sulfatase activity
MWLSFRYLCVLLLAVSFSVFAADMARVPAGQFSMGSDIGPDDERPAHTATLPIFDIDLFPVTNSDFAKFLSANGLRNSRGERRYVEDDNDARIHIANGDWKADIGFERHPVVEASWVGARDYCAWLGKRLPTNRARFAAGYNQTSVVDAFPDGRSPYGVWDLAGNAWEWVSSVYRPYPYRADDGRETMDAGPVRGTRGGGHDSPAAEITTTQRGRNLSRGPQAGHHNISFRCVRNYSSLETK